VSIISSSELPISSIGSFLYLLFLVLRVKFVWLFFSGLHPLLSLVCTLFSLLNEKAEHMLFGEDALTFLSTMTPTPLDLLKSFGEQKN
jgi:hypothetical protein